MASADAHVSFSNDVDVDPFPQATGTFDGPFANSKKKRCLSNVEITELLYAYVSVWNKELKHDQHAHYVAVDVVNWHQAITHYFNKHNHFLRQSVLGKLLFDRQAISHDKPEILVAILHVSSDLARYCVVVVDATFRQIVVFDTHSLEQSPTKHSFTDICGDLRNEMPDYHVKYISLAQYDIPKTDSIMGLFELLPMIFRDHVHDLPTEMGKDVIFTPRETRNMLSHALYTDTGKQRAHSSICKQIKIMLTEEQSS
jgi:hypothetical protein